MKRMISFWIAVGLLLSMCACSVLPLQGQRELTDGAGRKVALPEKIGRVVCVGVGALRYSCYLGCADLVVGVEDYETKESITRLYNYVNFEKFQNLPIIGTNGQPSAESIIDVLPDVIVMSQSASVDADQLQAKTGIPVFVIPGSDALLDDNCYATISLLGQLYKKQERAEVLAEYLRGTARDLRERMEGCDRIPSIYACGISFKGAHGLEGTEANYGPISLLGLSTLADEVGLNGAFDIDKEQVLSWDPDMIFVDYNGLELIRQDMEKNPEFYENLSAIQQGRVYTQISFRSYALNLETALVDAYYAGSVIYPQAFADLEEKIGEVFTMLLGENPYEALKEAGYVFTSLTLCP